MSIFRQVQIVVGTLVLLSVLGGFLLNPAGFVIAGLFGAALALAGMSGWCGMAILLGRMPWNKAA
ncbi:YgaP-like transmembrane domain [Rhizobium sp. 18055]|uniref:YgaP-like transmembrane domain n=1 Tax=Rhizobium sp. 18055 TaxID=2681403 RepID=UPI001FCF1A5A|nr:YgaP-like transmembrane domain [Rhizobium sp. 18055]